LGVATVVAVLAIATDPADARRRGKRSAYNPPFASIVVDANTGAVLQSTYADSRRHPASLAKIMTLYLLFERIEAGAIKLDSELPVSAHAASQPPTKLGLKPGETIEVDDAIKSLVTKSANDIAVVIAEAIGGTETAFARMMTEKARALGMRRTTYTNASGLPDSDQITTARDQALLGRAIQERFPDYYEYFSTRSFAFNGRHFKNHNRLLGRVGGVDGIKTGYTRDSGFNLTTSMHQGKRHVVAVVMGGRSAARRDAHMRMLLAKHIAKASDKRAAPALIAKFKPVPLPPAKPEGLYKVASATSVPVPVPVASNDATATVPVVPTKPELGSSDPIKPLLVRTIAIKPAAAKELDQSLHQAPAAKAAAPQPPLPPANVAEPASPPPASVAAAVPIAKPKPAQPTHAVMRTGWMIQVGAFDGEAEAKERLSKAQSRAKSILAKADAFTEAVESGDKMLYRARFAGLDKRKAEAACRALKRNSIACLILKN
jgi:D-alanyl-D-alanine carboxypeptidase